MSRTGMGVVTCHPLHHRKRERLKWKDNSIYSKYFAVLLAPHSSLPHAVTFTACSQIIFLSSGVTNLFLVVRSRPWWSTWYAPDFHFPFAVHIRDHMIYRRSKEVSGIRYQIQSQSEQSDGNMTKTYVRTFFGFGNQRSEEWDKIF